MTEREDLYAVSSVVDQTGQPTGASRLLVLDTATNELIQTIEGVDDAALSPDKTRLYVGMTGQLVAIDRQTQREVWRVPVNNRVGYNTASFDPTALAISPDGHWLYVYSYERAEQAKYFDTTDAQLQIVDTATGQVLPNTIPLHGCNHPRFFTPPTGDTLFVTCYHEIRLLNTQTHEWEPSIPVERAENFALAPNGYQIYAATTNHEVLLVDTEQRMLMPLLTLEREPDMAEEFYQEQVAPSNDETKLVVNRIIQVGTGLDSTMTSEFHVFDTRTWQEIQRIQYPQPVAMLAGSSDGQSMYAVSGDPNGFPDTIVQFDLAGEQVWVKRVREGESIRTIFVAR
jgi:outer membrane protein assembly factor BamB